MELRSVRSVVYLAAGVGIIMSIFSGLELVYASLTQICSFNTFFSCATVAHSAYTTIWFVPDWIIGLVGFIVIIAVARGSEVYPYDPRWAYALVGITLIGAGAAVYFLYVELALIGAFCVICSTSYVMGFICLGGAVSIARRTHEKDPDDDEP